MSRMSIQAAPKQRRFPAATFTPDERASSVRTMVLAQSRFELVLLLRNGEQLLLTLLVPIMMMLALCLLPWGGEGSARVDTAVPAVLSVAVMSTAFTGQSIAIGFARRYGALRLLGATALPRWALIAGRCGAVCAVVAGQSLLLASIGVLLGWRPSGTAVVLTVAMVVLGAAAFTALGMLLGGSLRAEIVLPLANALWFAMLGTSGLMTLSGNGGELLEGWLRVVPSVSFLEVLVDAGAGTADAAPIAVLLGWTALAGWGATQTFRFD